MTNNVSAQRGKFKAFGIVRDKYGKPRIDDPDNLPKEIWDMLTPEEQQEIENGKRRNSSR